MREHRRLFWEAAWLAIVLLAIKAYYLGAPAAATPRAAWDYVQDVAAVSFVDALFAVFFWICGTAALLVAGNRPRLARLVTVVSMAFGAVSCLYAIASIFFFGVFGGFLTYPLLALVGDVHMLRSSVAAELFRSTLIALAGVPFLYVVLVEGTLRGASPRQAAPWRPPAIALTLLTVWVAGGQWSFAREWTTRRDRQVAANAEWVLAASWWEASGGARAIRLAGSVSDGDLTDFEPLPAALVRGALAQARGARLVAARRPPNVILVVLESVAARWASLNGGAYDTTPQLKAESGRGVVFENFYAHIGRSSNSLGAILLSTFPKLDFNDLTEEYPRLPGTSLASVFHDRGYRTAFVTPSDLGWADWRTFLDHRGFGEVIDHHQLACATLLSSWGMEDRCAVDSMVQFIEKDPARPFFLMAWSQQTHHPYEPTPGVPTLPFVDASIPDAYDLGRYLNVLHETDRHLERLFETVRRAGLEQDTLIVVTGDHGQAFGDPHDTFMQGRTIYEEDVHVPLLIWYPRQYRAPARAATIGSHVDLAPTIADLAGFPAAPDWQGRSLFAAARAPRAYFYVAEDHFTLGVREENWKYIFDLREGSQELYDLSRDPNERHSLAALQPERSARLRQRLVAWTDANRRQYDKRGQ
ncbi:MAG TPA: sulfatase-like hydrolase/transferase [Vicinamibacterales bacterium]|nr:sulfatase-like hydrolase/transferase [Vicinamibacterales bacterium]